MELSVDSLKEVIIANPGINNEGLAKHFNAARSAVGYWLKKLKGKREENGDGCWLFIQTRRGINHYYQRTYAKANDIPEKILAPPTDWQNYRKAGKKKEDIGVIELSKMWAAPKGIT